MPSGITTIRNISRTYRHIGRYRKIVGILLKNGFGFLFKDLKVFSLLGFSKKEIDSSTEEARPLAEYAPRLRTTLVELGPTYVKLGQILSTRPDILPAELVNELALLRDHVPPFPFEQVRQIIREELHGEMEEFFSSFDSIKLYYDNGQGEISVLLTSTLSALLPQITFKRVIPRNYRFFQVVDLICTIKLVEEKYKEKGHLSKSEEYFFRNYSVFKKNYLSALSHLEMR